MFLKFQNLDSEKKERILNAALKEFAQKGFEKASTNVIVKEAKISKGLLFHYFNNKKELFLFLYDYFTEILMKDFYSKFDLEEKDIFSRLKQLMLLKLHLIKKYPEVMNFMIAATIEESNDVKNHLEDRNKEALASSYEKIFKDIDITRFKEASDIKRVIDIIIWTFEGFRNRQVDQIRLSLSENNDFDKAFADVDGYIEILKKAFYR